ncbi:transposase [Microbulbifer sp. TRSA005]|uniref:transposase n=1 Tax=Microbulbifer sp. TRSA005 TaxID=3243383 RepID=UPI004039ED3B
MLTDTKVKQTRCLIPKYNKPRKTWQYSNEFKVKAVMLSLIEGIQVKEVAETLDIHSFMLSRW